MNTAIKMMRHLFVSVVTVIVPFFGSIHCQAQQNNGLASPPIARPFPTSTKTLNDVLGITELAAGGKARVVMASTPTANDYTFRTVRKVRAYIVFHAGGDRQTYEFGKTAWSATVAGTLYGVVLGTPNTLTLLQTNIALSIDQSKPEAVFVLPATNADFQPENHIYYNGGSSTKYDELWFDIGTAANFSNVNPDINPHLRLSLRVDEEVVYNFPSSYSTLRCLVRRTETDESTLLSPLCSPPSLGMPDYRARKVSNSDIVLTWKTENTISGNQITEYEVELLRLYNTDPDYRTYSAAPFTSATVDWSAAKRFMAKSSGGCGSLRVVPIDGSGYYIFRVRPITTKVDGGAKNPRNLGLWSQSPSDGDVLTIDPCVCPYSTYVAPLSETQTNQSHVALFYFDDQQATRTSTSRQVVFNDTARGSYIDETRTYLDAFGRPVQSVARDRALKSALVSGIIYDRDGRPSLQSLPAPKMTIGNFYDDQMSYMPSLLRSGSALMTVANYDEVATTYFAPSTTDETSPGTRFFTNANPNKNIPSSEGRPYSRTLFGSDGSPISTILPGADRRPSSGDQKSRSTRVLSANTAQNALDAIFGAESPNAGSIAKVVTITPDATAFGEWRDNSGQMIASFAIASDAQVPGSAGTLAQIDSDGDGTLAMPNGDIGTYTSAEETLEDVLILQESVDMPEEFTEQGDTLVTTTKVMLTSKTALKVVVTYIPQTPQTITYGSEACTTIFTLNCNQSMFVKVFRVDTIPFVEITGSSPAMPRPFTNTAVTAKEYTFSNLPAGEYLIERKIISGGRDASGRTPAEIILETSMPSSTVASTLQSILTTCFGSSLLSSDQLAHYTTYRNGLEDPKVRKVKIGAATPAMPCYEIPLPAPVDCDQCPDGSSMPFESLQYAQYATARYASKFPGADTREVFFTLNAAGAKDTKINGSSSSVVEQRVNKIFEGLLTSTECEYSCKDLWLLWTSLVDSRIEALAASTGYGIGIPTYPKVPPGMGDIIEVLLQTVGLCIEDEVEDAIATDNTIDTDAEALAMHTKVRTNPSSVLEQSICIGNFTRISGSVTYVDWNAVNACIWNKLTPAEQKDLGKNAGISLPIPSGGDYTHLNDELIAMNLDKCRARCEELYSVVERQSRQENPGMTDGEIYCRARAVIDDCRESCVVSNPPSPAEVLKLKQITYGQLHLAPPEGLTCPEGYQFQANDGIKSRMLVNALLDYLNDHYDRMQKTVTTNTCINYGNVIYNFLLSFIPIPQIPACITYANLQGPKIGIESDCRAYENDPGTNQFYIRVLPGVPGKFVRPASYGEECDLCAIEFVGPRFAASDQDPPTLDPTEHEWVSIFNQMLTDLWGAELTSRTRESSTEQMAASADRWYEYAKKTVEIDSLGSSNIDSVLNDIVTQARDDLHFASSGVNGLLNPLLYFSHGATGISPAPSSWATPLWTPFGTILAFDNAAWRTHDTADVNDLQWRNFGTIGIQFDDRRASFSPTSSPTSFFSWTLLPSDEDTLITNIQLVTHVLGTNYVDTWMSTEPGSEYHDLADSSFLGNIGRFYMTDQWKLGYHDLIRNRRTEIDAVRFYTTHTRRLISNQSPAACIWDSLCIKEIGCAVCVKWDTLSATDLEHIDRTGPMPCDEIEVERLKAEISRLYFESLDKFRVFVENETATKCGANTSCSKVAAKTTERTYHYTLYYYDRAGRLVRTVSPKGVDMSPTRTRTTDPGHTFVSSFTVDSRGRILTKTVPDGGTEEYYYDRYGRLRFSVDAVQSAATPKRITYYKYDRLSRIEETGEAVLGSGETIASVVATKLDNSTATDPVSNPWPAASDNRVRNDVAKYFYDERASLTTYFTDALSRWAAVSSKLTGVTQRNVRGRLSWALAVPTLASGAHITTATTDVVRSYFSYDAHGNTISSISSVPYSSTSTADADFLITRTDYEYDLSTGSVVRVDFQPTVPAERFIHRYTYDGSGRLKYVETSRNDVLFDRDAAYDYNMNGTLRRETIGEDSVQGRDYTYTLLGQLKGINHPTLDQAKDPGQDGVVWTGIVPNPNEHVAKDAFGMAFHYHTGDFIHNTGATPSVFADGQAGMLGVATPLAQPVYDLYSGQIGAWTMKSQAIPAGTLNGATLLRNGTLVGERFRYDVLGRLREDTTYSHNGTNWLSDGAGGWSASFRYDQNSNMRKVNRWAMTTATLSQMIDEATFVSNSPSVNAVNQIVELGTSIVGNSTEITSLSAPGSTPHTNAVGQFTNVPMTADPASTDFNSIGTVEKHHTTNDETRFIRDPFGFHSRIDHFDINGASGTFDKSFYPIVIDGVSDRAVYHKDLGQSQPELEQWTIVGAQRVGSRYRDLESQPQNNEHIRSVGAVRYEVPIVSGSVVQTVSDVKLIDGATFLADVTSVSSYDQYGGARWYRHFNVGEEYRYGWQGMRFLLGHDEDVNYYTPNRLYDVRLAGWTTRDKVLNCGTGPYTGMGGSPIDAVDPDGLLVIFVNGFRKEGQNMVSVRAVYVPPVNRSVYRVDNSTFASWVSSDLPGYAGQRPTMWQTARSPVYLDDHFGYWGAFAPGFMDILGDHNDVYLDGSSAINSTATERKIAGRTGGKSLIDDIRSGRVPYKKGDIITVVAHSQGDAFSDGMIEELIAAGYPVETLYRIASKQPEDCQTHPSVVRSVQLYSPDDIIAPQAAVPGNGKTNMNYWELPKEFRLNDFWTSPMTLSGGFHTINSYMPYLDPKFQTPSNPARIVPVSQIKGATKSDGVTDKKNGVTDKTKP